MMHILYQYRLCNVGWAVLIYAMYCWLGYSNICYEMMARLYQYMLGNVG